MRLRALPHLLLALFFALSVAPAPAHADKAKAKDHFRKGMAKYDIEKWDEAITEFELGYTEEPDPVFLYNIAQAHRRATRSQKAVEFYRKFLNKRPDTPNRKEVEDHIAALEKSLTPSGVMLPGTTTKPGTTKPAETKPGTTKPTETKPVETKPVETDPEEDPRPVETKPVETKPVATKPVETKPAETKPVETKPAETKPVETKPAETKLALVTKPAETKPDEVPPGARPPVGGEEPPTTKKKTWPIWVGVAVGVLVAGGAATAAILLTRDPTVVLPPENAR